MAILKIIHTLCAFGLLNESPQDLEKMELARTDNFQFPSDLHDLRRDRHIMCSIFIWTSSGTTARSTTCVRVMHLPRYVLTHNSGSNLLHNSVVHLFAFREVCVMSFVCESEKSEMKVCLHRCTLWKAHQGIFNDTVEQLSETTKPKVMFELKKSAAERRQECVPAQCVYALKNMRAVRC